MASDLRTLVETDLAWVEIPAGRVCRGTPAAEIDDVVQRHADLGLPRHFFAKEAPAGEVDVPGFELARTQVTLRQWNAFAAASGRPTVPGPPDHPVDGRTWAEANDLCDWLTSLLGLPVRLPSELEWERAARGDDRREYPWGDRFDAQAANLVELGAGGTLPVGSLARGAGPFGVLDQAGNVDEWTSSLYAPYAGAPPDVAPVEGWAVDPHITRGGGFQHHRDLARCARRHAVYAPLEGAGIRLATC